MVPGLPPQVITSILSHLFPPNLPIPQGLVSKSLIDRHTFLPPGPGDLDAWLTPFSTSSSTFKSTSSGTSDTNPSDSSDTEIDHISTNNPIFEHLERLSSVGYEITQPVLYAFDGESTLSRLTVTPIQRGEREISVMFIYEPQEDRGWVYHSTTVSSSSHSSSSGIDSNAKDWSDSLEWGTSPNIKSTGPNTTEAKGGAGETISVEEYWKDFSSPKMEARELVEDFGGEEEEDAYWAKYGGMSGGPTRNQSYATFDHLGSSSSGTTEGTNGEHRSEKERDNLDREMGDVSMERVREDGSDGGQTVRDESEEGYKGGGGGGRRVMCDLPTISKQLDPLAALLSTIPDRLTDKAEDEERSETKGGSSRAETDLRDKMVGRIKSLLRECWNTYTEDIEATPSRVEEKAFEWLRLGRQVSTNTNTSTRNEGGERGQGWGVDQKEMVVLAKLEVLRDMWDTLHPEPTSEQGVDGEGEDNDGFWRCIEGAIKMPILPDNAGEGHTQETYWE